MAGTNSDRATNPMDFAHEIRWLLILAGSVTSIIITALRTVSDTSKTLTFCSTTSLQNLNSPIPNVRLMSMPSISLTYAAMFRQWPPARVAWWHCR